MNTEAMWAKDTFIKLEDLAVVIQAGGESRRMGRSKATVPFLGKPLIMRTVHRLSPIAGEMIITTNEPENLTFLSTEYGRDDIRLVRDVMNTRGALNGVYTALSSATKPYVAMIACDMIFASAPLVAYEYNLLKNGPYDLAVPKQSHGYEPFHAVYRREVCLRLVTEALARGEMRANSWYDYANLRTLDRDEVLVADPRGGAFSNINTPAELAEMEERILNDEITSAAERDCA